MKVFISQLMNGISDEDIIAERDRVLEILKEQYPDEEIEVLKSFVPRSVDKAKPLYCVGNALKFLSEADLAVFGVNWNQCRGCRVEHLCCKEYGIKILYLEDDN